MAHNPNIALSSRPGINVASAFNNALTNVTNAERLQQNRIQAPIRNRLLEAKTATTEAAVPSQTAISNQRQMEIFKLLALGAREVSGNTQEETLAKLVNRKIRLTTEGKDTTQTDQSIQLAQTDFPTFQQRAQEYIDLDDQLNQVRQQRSSVRSFAPVTIVNPLTKEKRLVTPTFDPNTGKAVLKPFDIPSGFDISRETPEERRNADNAADLEGIESTTKAKAEAARETAKAKKLGAAAAKKAGEAIKRVNIIRENNITLNKVIDEVRGGADTGPLASKLPSFRAASVRLDNLQKQLGLDVVSGVTFGALSKGELDLALSKALPTGLDGPELIQWAEDKIAAQEKLSTYLEDQAIFLSKPGNSEADWIELQRSSQQRRQQQQPNITSVPTNDLSNMTTEQLIQLRNQAQ